MQKFKNIIKNSFLGWIFLGLSLFMIKIIQIFIRPNPKSVMFMSYGGRQISDSPNEVYLKMMNDKYFQDWDLKWALNHPKLFKNIENKNKISSNNLFYFYHLLKAKYWVTNSSIDRLIPFNHPRNIYIQFWHGIPMKTLGEDEKEISGVVKWWYNHVKFDYHFVYGSFDHHKMEHIFKNSNNNNIIDDGLLRKSILKRRSIIGLDNLKKEIGIYSDKPIMLYVPSFRGYKTKSFPFLSNNFLSELSKEFTIIYRGHYYTENKTSSIDIKSFEDKSLYKLMLVSDFMVTDYSSVLFDYLPLRKRIFLFQKDIVEYSNRRGLYLKGEDLFLPVAYSEPDLKQSIHQNNYNYDQLDKLLVKYNNASEDKAWNKIKSILKQ